MSQIVDNLIAFKILHMLVTPFEETDAFKLGVIDKAGHPRMKIKDMNQDQRDVYTMLHRLVFRLKMIMAKIPIINTKLGTLAAAYFLVRECYDNKRTATNLEEDFVDLLRKIQMEDVTLVDEYILAERYFTEDMPANVTGVGVKTDEPIIRKRNVKQIQALARRAKPVGM